ncbi:MAG: hypothetical protein RQ763_10960 [Sulfurimonas sp.]|uniref:hypothetical protein n=1 Tax=Sulfurimonas sp. TaxID=2022749 RepID=UPI0028CD03EB|nr:hypothetical protein [Sulfurimonas sp.]MDT8339702.1 hypothetical protein [Sulfurimonas sp.]
MDETQIIKTLITAIIGGVVATYLKSLLDKKKELDISLNKITEDKYRSLLVFMACALDINKKRYFSLVEQTENKTSEDYMNQIKEYYYHSILYSSDDVIEKLKAFIESPSKNSYVEVAQAMRKDLWGRKTKLGFNEIELK